MSLDELKSRIAFVRDGIERNTAQSREVAAGRASDFWSEILERRVNYPDINQLMVCRREGIIDSIGDDPQGTVERERAYFARVHHLFRGMVDPPLMARLPETSFGSPLVFEEDGFYRSANFWINAATTHRVLQFLRSYGKAGPLRILEIGPGWGACAYQLHQVVDVESYTLLDLPENLYISTLHLSSVLPDRTLAFVDVLGSPVTQIAPKTLTACLPGAIRRLKPEYDLVLNSFSLQEMSLASVREYIDWISDLLSPEGIFVSLNSHNKTDLLQPADYRYEKFKFLHLGVFRTAPAGFFNTVPYEAVLAKRTADTPEYDPTSFNGIGWLMQLGLNAELSEVCANFVAGNLTSQQRALLAHYAAFFSAGSDQERVAHLERLRHEDSTAVLPFTAGVFNLARADLAGAKREFEDAVKKGVSGFARMKADLYLAGMSGRTNTAISPRDGIDPLYLYPEADAIRRGDFSRVTDHANRTLRRK